ncbi:hypothetical protein V6U81_26060 [Micromonospora sp. CPCC 205711]|uniref:hypothetical protein n=1 Tax=Micromonospora sp. CPCC 205547 TaxID=3122400 RepID=UPI002FF2D907
MSVSSLDAVRQAPPATPRVCLHAAEPYQNLRLLIAVPHLFAQLGRAPEGGDRRRVLAERLPHRADGVPKRRLTPRVEQRDRLLDDGQRHSGLADLRAAHGDQVQREALAAGVAGDRIARRRARPVG